MVEDARRLLDECDCVFVCTGAGMSKDSGIPTYRGEGGYWGPSNDDYHGKFGLSADQIMHFGKFFEEAPEKFWAYFWDQIDFLQSAEPHDGYVSLHTFLKNKDHFILTSNVDGMHIRAGADPSKVLTCHGSYFDDKGTPKVQCANNCNGLIWSLTQNEIESRQAPKCWNCSGFARPNILSFKDQNCNVEAFTLNSPNRQRMVNWLKEAREAEKRIAIIEIGVGTAVKTVRNRATLELRSNPNACLIRINPFDNSLEQDRVLPVKMTAKDGLTGILE
jgi:NAD-dependent SIR2 family protein deacetylase